MKRLLITISCLCIFIFAAHAHCIDVIVTPGNNASCSNSCDGSFLVSVIGGNPPYSYQWNGTGPLGQSVCPGVYHITATDVNGCQDTISHTVTAPFPLLATINVIQQPSCTGVCDGNFVVTAAGGTPPYMYQWSGSGPLGTNVCPGTYTVTVTDMNACVALATVNLNSISALINGYQGTFTFLPGSTWDFGDGNVGTGATVTHTYASPGTYTVTATDGTCSSTITIVILSVCIDSTKIDLNMVCTTVYDPVCGCDGITYGNICEATNWGGVTAWTVGACGAANCQDSITTTINNLTVDFALTGNIQFYYFWTFGDGNDAGVASPTHTYAVAGTYNVTAVILDSAGNQCIYNRLITVGGGGPLCIDASLIDLTVVCPGLNPVCGCDNVTYDNACIAQNCYGVTTWTQGPCAGSQDSTCTTTSSFLYTDVQGPFGHDVYFFGSGTGAGPLTYYWDFGDNSTGTGINVTHTYTDTTSIDSLEAFSVCLTVLDSTSCVANYCETIVVVVNPNGNIAGGIYEASNFTGNGGVSNGKSGNGDPIPNVTIHLERADGVILSTDVTDALGLYSFDQLQFGDYRIRVDMAGITHAGEAVSLSPVVQQLSNLDFEVDDDGNVSTDIETIAWLNAYQLYPNPAQERVMVEVGASETLEAMIQVQNTIGQVLYRQQVNIQEGIQTYPVDLSGLPSGVYLISLQSSDAVVTRKLLKH